MSDRLQQLKHITDEAVEITRTWNSMKADLERCHTKIERLRGELAFANDQAEAMDLLMAIRFMDYTAHQYKAQLERFPAKLAEIRKQYLVLPLTSDDVRLAGRKGGLN